MQMVILLNRKVVPGLQCQYLGTPHPQVSCEGLRLLHSVAWLAGSPHSKTTARTDSVLGSTQWLSLYGCGSNVVGTSYSGLHILGRATLTNECPRKIRRWFLLKYLPPRLLKLPSKSGTCFSSFLCLSFHHTHCSCRVYPQALAEL